MRVDLTFSAEVLWRRFYRLGSCDFFSSTGVVCGKIAKPVAEKTLPLISIEQSFCVALT